MKTDLIAAVEAAEGPPPHEDYCFLSGGDDGRWPCICPDNRIRARSQSNG
jgi:hypothetical protein